MKQIDGEIGHLLNRLSQLKSAEGHARAEKDIEAVQTINQQLGFVNAKYNSLIQEQHEHSSILQQQALLSTSATGIAR